MAWPNSVWPNLARFGRVNRRPDLLPLSLSFLSHAPTHAQATAMTPPHSRSPAAPGPLRRRRVAASLRPLRSHSGAAASRSWSA